MPPIDGASLPIGATFSPSGGTATGVSFLSSQGSTSRFLLTDDANYRLRKTFNFTNTESQQNSGYPGGATPNKRRVSVVSPVLLDDGSYFNNQVIIEIIAHPELEDTDINALQGLGMLVLSDADFAGFWETGARG